MPARKSLALGGLPIGLAHRVKLNNNVRKDQSISWADVDIDLTTQAVSVRKQMESLYS
jgi:predicted homoserine dehydrogenase-like protein